MAFSAGEPDVFVGSVNSQPTDVETTKIVLNRVADLVGYEVSDVAVTKTALALHYGIGAAGGYVYCLLGPVAFQRFEEEHSLLAGAAFGSAFFLAADLATLALRGFPDKGSQSPLGTRFYGLSSHIIYGVAAAQASKAVRIFL
ncbi:MAG TPA: hypothetical protein VJQ59_07030 [Candidatus Sulfotelmatobacter sp.]|nr:hypothetical protein [Candidatus Sulfotelmatobacter sp.]